MSDILLIHGSCHGAWCWDAVIPPLAALGLDARAIDLPGRNGAGATLHEQADAVLAALDRPALIVGHSAGGFAITAAAERDPARVRGLVYLCAYLPLSGMSLADMRRAGPSQPLLPAIRVAGDRRSFSFDPVQAGALLYHDCPQAMAARAIDRLCAEPVAPQETPLVLHRSPALPRHYIRCSEDRAIPPGYQATMAATLPVAARHSLATGHSPFFAAPERLAGLLAQIMRSV
jgi:pimeloyl-ACP methyl ester carboxylesterase